MKLGVNMIGQKFHEHLSKCEQCRTQPFNLCVVGSQILEEVKKEVKKEVKDDNVCVGREWYEVEIEAVVIFSGVRRAISEEDALKSYEESDYAHDRGMGSEIQIKKIIRKSVSS